MESLRDLGLTATQEQVYLAVLARPGALFHEMAAALSLDVDLVTSAIFSLRDMGLARPRGDGWGVIEIPDAVRILAERRRDALRRQLGELEDYEALAQRLNESATPGVMRPEAGETRSFPYAKFYELLDELAFFTYGEIWLLSAKPQFANTRDDGDVVEDRHLRRGHGIRCVIQETALASDDSLAAIREAHAKGIRFRVVPVNPVGFTIFNKECILTTHKGHSEPTVVVSRDPALVQIAVNLFLDAWDRGVEWEDLTNRGEAPLVDAEKAVVHAICFGGKDEVEAKRLGMSVRTYRRHVSNLQARVGATSRAHFALCARDRGWV